MINLLLAVRTFVIPPAIFILSCSAGIEGPATSDSSSNEQRNAAQVTEEGEAKEEGRDPPRVVATVTTSFNAGITNFYLYTTSIYTIENAQGVSGVTRKINLVDINTGVVTTIHEGAGEDYPAVAVNSTNFFYIADGVVYSVPLGSSTSTQIAVNKRALAVVGETLYMMGDQILTQYENGSETIIKDFNPGPFLAHEAFVTNGDVSLFFDAEGNLQRLNHNDGTFTILGQDFGDTVLELTLDGNTLHFMYAPSLMSVDINTGATTTIRDSSYSVGDYVISSFGTFYLSQPGDGNTIYKMSESGSDEEIITGIRGLVGIDLQGLLYYTVGTTSTETIYEIQLQ